jgi:hypothetical protein
MSCDNEQNAFKDKFSEVQATLKTELEAIATDTEQRAKQIADDFERDHDLAEGVGAVAGTTVGGVMAGAAGAALGGVIGKQIGSLFTLEVGIRREVFSLDVPQTIMETRDFSFDLPSVVVRDTDISFDIPTIQMQTVEGPPIPETTIRMEQQCVDLGPFGRPCTDVPVPVITWKKTYVEVPVTVMKTQRIVVGLPQVEMRRQDFRLDVPVISMKTTEFSADIPFITLRFIQDAGKRTAALAAALAQSAQDAATQRQAGYKARLRSEVAPLAIAMFSCFREQIVNGQTAVRERFSDQLQTLRNAVTAIAARGTPEDSPELNQARSALDSVISKQNEALSPLDEALKKLDESARAALAQFLGDGKAFRQAKGGLHDVTAVKPSAHATVPGLIGFSTKERRRGLYLTVGLNGIDPYAYGDPGTLLACENDARDMALIAQNAGFTGKTLLTEKATASAVLEELATAASALQPNDILFLSFSGHGAQVADVTHDEADGLDETWCLYDRQLLDDELYAMWAKFRPGVRIFVLSDSCHSGTVTRELARMLNFRTDLDLPLRANPVAVKLADATLIGGSSPNGRSKALPFSLGWKMYLKDKPMYDSLQFLSGSKKDVADMVAASVILISGCQDDQVSFDGTTNGVFTEALKSVWQQGSIANYSDFCSAITDAIAHRSPPVNQTPNYYVVGAKNAEFEAQIPFTV